MIKHVIPNAMFPTLVRPSCFVDTRAR